MKNYGKIIRTYVILENMYNAKYNEDTFKWRGKSDYLDLLSFNAVRAHAVHAQESDIVLSTMVVLEVFVEVYKILNLREKLDIIDDIDAHLLEEMRKVEQFEDIVNVLCRKANISLIGDAVEFDNLSAFDKVLQTKALDENDLAILRRIFPLFEGEYEHYNVEVDEDFMIRQIGKWQTGCNDDIEKSYEEAANFLEQYSLINNSLYERIRQDTGCIESSDRKDMLKKFYQSR